MARISTDPKPRLRACTVTRRIEDFGLLVAELQAYFGTTCDNLTPSEALMVARAVGFGKADIVIVILDSEDAQGQEQARSILEAAQEAGKKTLLIAEAVSPTTLHRLLRAGADEFVPYPLPERALNEALDGLKGSLGGHASGARSRTAAGKDGRILAIQSLAGGAGGSTFAVNLAWELAGFAQHARKSVCILDLDLQSGSVATYLDLTRTEKVYELLSQTSHMDDGAFLSALHNYRDRLHVLTAPAEMLPLDLLIPEEIERVIAMARQQFDIVIVDMPRTIVHWTEAVLDMSELYFTVLESDLRSAYNTLRMIRAMRADGIGLEKFRFILNRAPRLTDLAARAYVRRMAESLGIEFYLTLPDGGSQIRAANDQGLPLAEYAPKNPLSKEIRRFAKEILNTTEHTVIAAE